MNTEEKIRKQAIILYLEKEQPIDICRELNRGKTWFYKWLHRYQTGDPNWYKEQSRAPRKIPHKTDVETENMIINIRNKLESTKYSQIGANRIAYEFTLLGEEPPPAWVINRVLARHNMVRKPSREKYKSKNIEYPYFQDAKYLNYIHQADFVGPRYIKDDGKFYSFNIMDIFSHRLYMYPLRYHDDRSTGQALVGCWKYLGLPDYIQFDNATTFHGSNRHPRQFGYITRLCLIMGIEPIFIPIKEPWRNGTIEKLNDTYDTKFFRNEHYRSFNHLTLESQQYNEFHNEHYVYSCIKSKTPNQIMQESSIQPKLLFEEYQAPYKIDFIPPGIIHVIRFIRSDCMLNIFGESFKMPKDFQYSYLRAAIKTGEQIMEVYCGDTIVETFDYKLNV